MELYRVVVKVRPHPAHPKFWELQFGYLCLWLFAESPDDAGQKGALIVEQLPYERVGDSLEIHEDTLGIGERFQTQDKQARQIGLALLLVACPTGTEEKSDAGPE